MIKKKLYEVHQNDELLYAVLLHSINGLVQERLNSTANALELRLSCTNSSI